MAVAACEEMQGVERNGTDRGGGEEGRRGERDRTGKGGGEKIRSVRASRLRILAVSGKERWKIWERGTVAFVS